MLARLRLLLWTLFGLGLALGGVVIVMEPLQTVLHDRAVVDSEEICAGAEASNCLNAVHGDVVGGWERHDWSGLEWQLRTNTQTPFAGVFSTRDTERLEALRGHFVTGWYVEDRAVAIVKAGRVIPTLNLDFAELAWVALLGSACFFMGFAAFIAAGTALLLGKTITLQAAFRQSTLHQFLGVPFLPPLAFALLVQLGLPPTWGVVGTVLAWLGLIVLGIRWRAKASPLIRKLRLPKSARIFLKGGIGVGLLFLAGSLALSTHAKNADRVAVAEPLVYAEGERCLTMVKGWVTECDRVSPRRASAYYVCYFEVQTGDRVFAPFTQESFAKLQSTQYEFTRAWLSKGQLVAIRLLPAGDRVVSRNAGVGSAIGTGFWGVVFGFAGLILVGLAVEDTVRLRRLGIEAPALPTT